MTTIAAATADEHQAATVPAWLQTADEREQLTESTLPETHHQAFAMRLQGKSVSAIAQHFGVDRTTVWRWIQKVAAEFREQLENEPTFNIFAREVQNLDDLERQARENAERTNSDRARTGFLAEARRCCTARTNLLLTCGVIPKAPEHLYRATVNLKPEDLKESADDEENMSRQEAIAQCILRMQKEKSL